MSDAINQFIEAFAVTTQDVARIRRAQEILGRDDFTWSEYQQLLQEGKLDES